MQGYSHNTTSYLLDRGVKWDQFVWITARGRICCILVEFCASHTVTIKSVNDAIDFELQSIFMPGNCKRNYSGT